MSETKKILNIKEFSKLAGVSTATVSRVFSRDSKVKETTAARIIELAEQYNFRPNQIAKSSFNGKTRSIGVLLCSLSTSYFADIALGIQQVLLAQDYLPIIVSLRSDGDMVAMRRLVDHRVDGIIACIADKSFTEEELHEINFFQLPVVTADASAQKIFSDNISSDEVKCGQLAAEYFLKSGHYTPGFIYTSVNDINLFPRFIAYKEFLEKQGIKLDGKVFSSEVKESLADWLKQQTRPFACYCYNDTDAYEVYKAAAELGLSIPDDISVIGTGDLNYAKMMYPPLTTIKQDGEEIGRMAASLMLKRLSGDKSNQSVITSDVSLIERESVLKI